MLFRRHRNSDETHETRFPQPCQSGLRYSVLKLLDTVAEIVFRMFRCYCDGGETAFRSRSKQKETGRKWSLGLIDTVAGFVFRVFRRCCDGDETGVRKKWEQTETERDNGNRIRNRHVSPCGNIKTF